MEDIRAKVLGIVHQGGPILPVTISKLINQNILFTSAILSELISRNQLLLSKAKIGGSPVYYVKGQEEKLQMLYNYLGDVHKIAYSLLKEKNIVKDSDCEPYQRVALREIRDFAAPFNFNNEIFWRWYLLDEENAKKILEESIKKPEIIELRNETQEKLQEKVLPEEEILETPLKLEKPKRKPRIKKSAKSDIDLLDKINNYFNKNNIELINENIIKKSKEINYNLRLESSIGKVSFFCKLKIKKSINDGDLSLAINEAKGRQVLFLSNGELTKKAKEFLEKEKESIIFNSI
ncbi:hypothetical protein HYX17_03415 [Candidatus Woesearchaeota archaeon]|nr:hypothetical protein [Candidatus Woesearchaeota archaeon]